MMLPLMIERLKPETNHQVFSSGVDLKIADAPQLARRMKEGAALVYRRESPAPVSSRRLSRGGRLSCGARNKKPRRGIFRSEVFQEKWAVQGSNL